MRIEPVRPASMRASRPWPWCRRLRAAAFNHCHQRQYQRIADLHSASLRERARAITRQILQGARCREAPPGTRFVDPSRHLNRRADFPGLRGKQGRPAPAFARVRAPEGRSAARLLRTSNERPAARARASALADRSERVLLPSPDCCASSKAGATSPAPAAPAPPESGKRVSRSLARAFSAS